MASAKNIHKFLFLSIILTTILCLCGCEKERSNPHAPPRLNLLLISIESLRFDHVGCYGYERPVTPNIDKLAARGVQFDRVYAQSSWTKPSIASMFTSTYFSHHDLNNNYPEKPPGVENPEIKRFPVLREGFKPWGVFFSNKGMRCFGYTSNRHLWSDFGFGRGFFDYSAGMSDQRAMSRALDVINSGREPWFLFRHIMATHWDYDPPAGYRIYDEHPAAISVNGDNWTDICDGKIKLSPDDIEHNIALYDGEIAFVDHMVGRMVDALETAGLLDRTVIVVMSDHGEEFMEHGGVGHGRSLYEEVIRVPLIIAGPGVPAGVKVKRLVQNIDAYPTLARLAGYDPPSGLQGRDLAPLWKNENLDNDLGFAYSEVEVDMHAIIGGRFKYILNLETNKEELYDIVEDPREINNLADVEFYGKIKARLAVLLKKFIRENRRLSGNEGEHKSIKASTEVLGRIRALGYVR